MADSRAPGSLLTGGMVAGSLAGLLLSGVEVLWTLSLPGPPLSWDLPGAVVATLVPLAAAVGVGVELLFQRLPLRMPRGRIRLGFGGLALLAALASYAADRWVLPRLYPWAHLALGFAAVLAAVVGVRSLLTRSRLLQIRSARWLLVVLVAMPVLTTAVAGERLRGALAEHTSLSSRVWSTWWSAAHSTTAGAVVPGLLAPGTGSAPADLARFDPPDPRPALPMSPGADVLLVTIDALRADHVGAYGYSRPTTPALDRLASAGVRFEHAFAYAPGTALSVTALMAGAYTAAYVTDTGAGREPPPLWATILSAAGYRTVAVYWEKVLATDPEALARWEGLGFEEVHRLPHGPEAAATEVNRIARDALAVDDDRPLFLWVHYAEPHSPYDPEPYPGATGSAPLSAFGADSDADRYDGEVAVADAALAGLLTMMASRERPYVTVVAGDHGEAFGDHGTYYHSTTLYDEQLRVPLVVAAPGLEPRVWREPVSLVGVRNAVLELVNVTPPPGDSPPDIGPALVGRDPGGVPFAQISGRATAMVARDRWKLICDLRGGWCSLYDRVADPGELANLVESEAGEADLLRAAMARELRRAAVLDTAPPELVAGHLGDPSAAPSLRRLLVDPGAAVEERVQAARLLGRLNDLEAAAALASVRGAASGARALRDEATLSRVELGVADSADADWLRRSLGDGEAAPLAHHARLASGLVRVTAGAEGNGALLAALSRVAKPIPRTEIWIWQPAVLAAAHAGAAAVEPLVAFSRADKNVRWQVLEALRRIGGPAAVAAVRRVRDWDPDSGNQRFAERVLRELGGG